MHLLGHKNTGAGRIDALGINATDLMARRRRTEGAFAGGRDRGVRSRHRTHQTAVLSLDVRNFDTPTLVERILDRDSELRNGLARRFHPRGIEDLATGLLADLERRRATTTEISKCAQWCRMDDLRGVIVRGNRGTARANAHTADFLSDGRKSGLRISGRY